MDRSRSGDLRAASRLSGGYGQDAKGAQPNLTGLALAAGATAAIAGIASSSKYDPVRDKGKGRADMADVYVSVSDCCDHRLTFQLTNFAGGLGRGPRLADVSYAPAQRAQATEHANHGLAVAT